MKRLFVSVISALLVLSSTSNASAQLVAAKDGPVVYGHHHLNASNVEAQKKFFVDTLGGTAIKFGANNADVVKFPNVLIFFRQQAPTGGTIGTTVNHIGFSVPNLRQTVDKIKANGFKMITRTEVAQTQEVKDDIAVLAGRNLAIAFALGPDDVKVELVESKEQAVPITLHHVHFFGQQNTEMQAWYVKVFGAKPGMGGGGAFPNASLPGVALNFSPSPDPVVGTQGRALDHIGFEVKNLEEFCKKLEADGIKFAVAYRKVPAVNLAIAFITDPWGSYIELTEGLDKVN
jgi:catechol 2,3-dioxygenase-like lactoylglutathione lyase family enzyme